MKKIFLLLSILFAFIFIFSKNVYAICKDYNVEYFLKNRWSDEEKKSFCSEKNAFYCSKLGHLLYCCTESETECLGPTPTLVPSPSYLGGIGNTQCVQTSLGCIPTNSSQFTTWLLRFAIGIGGGIAFLLMLWGGLQIVISTGNPEKVKAGREMMTSALAGLLLIIFSVFLLRLIGYDILRLPGFRP